MAMPEGDHDRDFVLEQFHREYRPALMAFFLRRVGSQGEAEDLTQEVFIRIAATDQPMQSAKAYMFQVAANLLRDRARRDKVKRDHAAGYLVSEGAGIETLDPLRVAMGREQLAILQAALAELPERARRFFLLARFENVHQRTIAESFGVSVSTVEKELQRAMAQLIAKVGKPE